MARLGPSTWGYPTAFTGNLVPKFPGVQDIGTLKFPVRNVYVSGQIFSGGNETVTGTLTVTGATLLQSTLGVTGNTLLGGTLGITGITTTSEDIKINVAGKGLAVKSGANAKAGTVVANGATGVPVSTTAITANSAIMFGLKTVGGTPAPIYMDTVTPGVGFSVTSTAGNTSTYNWVIVDLI